MRLATRATTRGDGAPDMNAAPARGSLLISAITAVALGVAIGVAGVFAVTAMAGQAPEAQATTVQVLEYGTR
jgi:hypothetical protein